MTAAEAEIKEDGNENQRSFKVALNMLEATWQFKVIEWYRGTGPYYTTTPEIKVLQLRASCFDVRQGIYDSSDYSSLDIEDIFSSRMKDLAVIRIH